MRAATNGSLFDLKCQRRNVPVALKAANVMSQSVAAGANKKNVTFVVAFFCCFVLHCENRRTCLERIVGENEL